MVHKFVAGDILSLVIFWVMLRLTKIIAVLASCKSPAMEMSLVILSLPMPLFFGAAVHGSLVNMLVVYALSRPVVRYVVAYHFLISSFPSRLDGLMVSVWAGSYKVWK